MKSSVKQGIVWGGLLIVLGILALVETLTDLSEWLWVVILVAGGLVAFAVYITDRSETGLLILSYVLLAVAGLIALLTLEILRDAYVATYVLTAIGLPFLVAFFRTGRSRWGLLIPAYVLLAIGVMVPLIEEEVLVDAVIATYVLLVIAIPFFVVYARNPKQWWALIPGGITALIGLSLLIAEDVAQYVAPVVFIIAGVWVLVRQLTRSERDQSTN